jgi:hypothetical protein
LYIGGFAYRRLAYLNVQGLLEGLLARVGVADGLLAATAVIRISSKPRKIGFELA